MLVNNDYLPGNLPNVEDILPFIALFSVVVLTHMEEDRYRIVTTSLPELSILRATGFERASSGTSSGDPHVARIFRVLDLPASPLPVVYGQIPFSPSNPEFAHRGLWHIGIDFPVILTNFICAIDVVTSDIEEIRLALQIRVLIQASEIRLSFAIGAGSNNNEDEHNTKSPKRLFDQFNDDNIKRDRRDGNDENDDFGTSFPLFKIANLLTKI
ncbi:hypothetical protein PILCRDRAFT_11698 [Piloderma croceum F 1598]|uniref:Uncharacterized protein n=1 Tax=Piloderma croceum (strain F 1598) TaxID=765440 RepID=A0A0C3EZ29_PILCF|nr:hypothetical protein PILCRDRAFT_11698 [Piloderma croceum F 1598]